VPPPGEGGGHPQNICAACAVEPSIPPHAPSMTYDGRCWLGATSTAGMPVLSSRRRTGAAIDGTTPCAAASTLKGLVPAWEVGAWCWWEVTCPPGPCSLPTHGSGLGCLVEPSNLPQRGAAHHVTTICCYKFLAAAFLGWCRIEKSVNTPALAADVGGMAGGRRTPRPARVAAPGAAADAELRLNWLRTRGRRPCRRRGAGPQGVVCSKKVLRGRKQL
jgi:hypothetical protein